VGAGPNYSGNKRIEEGRGGYCSGLVTGERNGWRLMMTGGSHLLVSGGEEKHTGLVEGFLGRGLVAVLGRKGSPGSSFTFLFLFFFSFSVF
jgi:hypothetical protein